jgi:hypothetical protein
MKFNKITFLPQIFLGVLFAVASFIIPNHYDWVLIMMLVGTFFLYFFSPPVAFIYSLIFVIDPMATFKLSAISIVPIVLCFTYLVFNLNNCILLLRKDKYLKVLMRLCLAFSLYQIIVSILLLNGGQDFYYLFINVRYWLGIWILIPAYIFVIVDRHSIFISITIVAFLIMVFYYLTFFGIYEFFEMREFLRDESKDALTRFFSFDLRQITKIYVYLLPVFLFFPIKNKIVKISVSIIGVMVYASILLAILRTEMFYLLMGALLATYISARRFKTIGKFKIIFFLILSGALVVYLFPNFISEMMQIVEITMSGGGNMSKDASADHRKYIQLPVLLNIIGDNVFFGGGLYAVSAEATTHYLLYDIPVLGAFGAYGIFGMLLYYSRFYIIFKSYIKVKMSQSIFNRFPLECLILNTLLAYFITMIAFRTLHINIELAFDFGMAEFGLFLGIYFGLIKILNQESRIKIERK